MQKNNFFSFVSAAAESVFAAKAFCLACAVWFAALLPVKLAAQSLADSLLPAVEIRAVPYQTYAAGTKLQPFDSLSLHQQAGKSLATLLMQRSPLYLKEYGPGQLASVSFRGTGASHTAVLWNGLPINSPTLGQADFSLIPLFALEDVQVQYGASSALYGSGALGGSIQLQSAAPKAGAFARARLEAGSFGRLFSGVAAASANHRWSMQTKAYRQSAENDFPYVNTLHPDKPIERNYNSAFEQLGLVQDLSAKIGKAGELQFNGWWQQTAREVQPAIGVDNIQDQQQDEHLRLNLSYQRHGARFSWKVRSGWVQEELVYNGSPFWSRQLVGQLETEYAASSRLSLQAGSLINHILSRNEAYEGGSAHEIRTDLYGMLRWQLWEHWQLNGSVRQVLVTGYEAPLSPSIGLQGRLFKKGIHLLALNASAGRSFRVPTFNDRFWPLAGNPNLRPENAWSAEAGFDYHIKVRDTRTLTFRPTLYSIWSADWIQWRPAQGGLWRPQNLLEVHSRGAEAQLELAQTFSQGSLTMGGQVAYTRATNEKSAQQHSWTLGKQLAFTPLWRGNVWSQLRLQQWMGELGWTYTGRRFTDGAELLRNSLAPFALLNAAVGRDIKWQQHAFHVSLQGQNLLNKQYQNYERRAMPGRSFILVINYQFKL